MTRRRRRTDPRLHQSSTNPTKQSRQQKMICQNGSHRRSPRLHPDETDIAMIERTVGVEHETGELQKTGTHRDLATETENDPEGEDLDGVQATPDAGSTAAANRLRHQEREAAPGDPEQKMIGLHTRQGRQKRGRCKTRQSAHCRARMTRSSYRGVWIHPSHKSRMLALAPRRQWKSHPSCQR